jgi:hypothetical protein
VCYSILETVNLQHSILTELHNSATLCRQGRQLILTISVRMKVMVRKVTTESYHPLEADIVHPTLVSIAVHLVQYASAQLINLGSHLATQTSVLLLIPN